MALKARKQVAAKQKEAEKRQNETLTRKNLAGLRVLQKNLVYVVGMNGNRMKEDELLKTLRGHDYFGQYGKIVKIVVSKAKEGSSPGSIGVYVTFAKKEDAEKCIAAVDGSTNGDRVLRYVPL
jgi:CCR4-NOT transcription complex subunit 4